MPAIPSYPQLCFLSWSFFIQPQSWPAEKGTCLKWPFFFHRPGGPLQLVSGGRLRPVQPHHHPARGRRWDILVTAAPVWWGVSTLSPPLSPLQSPRRPLHPLAVFSPRAFQSERGCRCMFLETQCRARGSSEGHMPPNGYIFPSCPFFSPQCFMTMTSPTLCLKHSPASLTN